jgi:tetratricopeptide (TPR) repeat protein
MGVCRSADWDRDRPDWPGLWLKLQLCRDLTAHPRQGSPACRQARKNIFFAAVCALAATASLSRAQAQQSLASTLCDASEADGVSLDRKISGCSTEILSGTLSNSDLALAYTNRGIAYSAKGQLDRAIQDYDQAIELDASDADFFYARSLARAKKGDKKGAAADLAAVRWFSSITQALSQLPPTVAEEVAGLIGGAGTFQPMPNGGCGWMCGWMRSCTRSLCPVPEVEIM